ncbi:hypothetical protein NY596_16010 [Enterobacter hormaechei]|uniref:hypothetical protein n=1 Tax=Enterobacter cloacae complex TaxID=354276 RepID=UPI00168D77B4|nr:hypothetical protein [Enterobacter hormaechei]MDA4589962.1 hypothetical protein [Enterobacter hormaechei]MDA4605328.1 hypothetical protein [Enterobacter hormaechei]MDA4657164.1 hypothetical protein [Enterobacter hormaechei]MDA4674393.1 hypothetical protein [Enterobacter hormaechei]MDA4687893.1 hypothetical protein [Enterobacter hormaechei]
MKEDIQKSVTEMIDKSGVEIDADERQKIVGEAIDAALEHIAQVLKTVSLAEGSSYMRVWVRFGESPELPGIKQKRAALVAFMKKGENGSMEIRTGAWYDGRIVFTNYAQCLHGEELLSVVDITLRAIKNRAETEEDTACAAFLSIIELPEVMERSSELKTPPGLLDLVVNADTKKAVQRVREVEYGTICDMCHSDLDLVRIIVDDGVLASFAGQVVRLANDLPMVKQEAKSYAVHHANELLEPFRFEAAQGKMTGWATW